MAAGRGTRMGPLTESIPKALIPFAGTTSLGLLLPNLEQAAPISITIGLGWFGDFIRDYVRSTYPDYSINFVDVPNYEIGPLETLVTSAGEIDSTTIICPADLIAESSFLENVIDSHISSSNRLLTLAYDTVKDKGTPLAIDENGILVGIGELPDTIPRSGRSAMVLVAEPEFFAICRKYRNLGMTRVRDVIAAMLAEQVVVHTHLINETWYDIDSISALLEVNRNLLGRYSPSTGVIYVPEGDVLEMGEDLVLDSGTTIQNGVLIKGPTFIAHDCFIGANSAIGPHVSMETGTSVQNSCNISNAVIFESANVSSGTHLSNVIVRRNRVYTE
ncbi:MAG: NDP-sugar synthase [Candidatus Thorarchaeota archaeon]|nr:NDP-sugar synthase [Candidatus Thorarchaeota archaeon]